MSAKKAFGEAAFHHLYTTYRNAAEARGYSFDLDKDTFRLLTQGDCRYCGSKPSQVRKLSPGAHGHYVYNGLDRVANDKGYTPDNVITCCKFCNYAKRDRSRREFEVWLVRAASNVLIRRRETRDGSKEAEA